MKRILLAGAALVVLALLLLAIPPAPGAYEAPIPREERARNGAILVALAAGGIDRAWVDAGDEAILVVVELPPAIAEEDALRFALASAALVAKDDRTRLTARTTEGAAWSVDAGDVRAHQGGALAREALEARIVRGAPIPPRT